MKCIDSDTLLPDEYQRLAERTEADPTKLLQLPPDKTVRLIHAGAGLTTEAGEFWDALKRHIFYGQPLDERNLAEEVGDLMWYVALACNALGVSLEQLMKANLAKLKARFPERFDPELAKEENRDRAKEQEVLSFDGDHPPEESIRKGAFTQLNDTPGAPAPPVGVLFEDKVCETCGAEASRAIHDRSRVGNKSETHYYCYKHARRAMPLD